MNSNAFNGYVVRPSAVLLFSNILVLTVAFIVKPSTAAGVFGDMPGTSMEPPRITADALAARLTTGDLSYGDTEGSKSLAEKNSASMPTAMPQAQAMQTIADMATTMPPVLLPNISSQK